MDRYELDRQYEDENRKRYFIEERCRLICIYPRFILRI